MQLVDWNLYYFICIHTISASCTIESIILTSELAFLLLYVCLNSYLYGQVSKFSCFFPSLSLWFCRHLFFLFLSPQTLYTHIVADIKNINAKHKNNKVNTVSTHACTLVCVWLSVKLCDTAALNGHHSPYVSYYCVFQTLQNFMYTMLRDSNPIAAKISLDVMAELYKRNIWWAS